MSITVTDRAGVLSPQDLRDLTAAGVPFHVKAVLASTTKPDQVREMQQCVDTPTTICVGVDPVHRFTHTEFGVDTGVAAADYQQVARAGNAEFRDGRWADGIQAIAARAGVLAHHAGATTPVIITQPTTVVDHGVSPWPFVAGGGALALLGLLIWVLVRQQRRRTEEVIAGLREERAEMASRNIRAEELDETGEAIRKIQAAHEELQHRNRVLDTIPHDDGTHRAEKLWGPRHQTVVTPAGFTRPTAPAVLSPAYFTAPPVMVQPASSGLVEGVMLGSMLSRPAVVEREVYVPREHTVEPVRHHEPTPVPTPSYDWSSSDSGGSSSSFDSSSSGGFGGGFDSFSGGGGGSDF